MILNIRYLFTGDSESNKTFTEQNGGKNIIKGIRYENQNHNINSNIDNTNSDTSSEMYGGKRNKPSISDKLHQDAIDYLKNDLKLYPLEARAYKSLAYRFIKEKYPDATSAERSKLMISLIKSESFLDEFKDKLDETIKILENIDSEKEKNNLSEEKKIKKTK